MDKVTLVIMAAGMGSRYGGLKQVDPVGPDGEIIMDYSVYDAVKAGFDKAVIVIKKENESIFRDIVGKKIEKEIDLHYAFQEIDDLPKGFTVPPGRTKPWGTAHAVMSCRHLVNEPFAVINADDFYGRTAFSKLYNHLSAARDGDGVYDFCMVGFILENTLTDYGHVSRGVCSLDRDDNLKEITERTKIKIIEGLAKYTENDRDWIEIPAGSIVSMNAWGFTPGVFREIEEGFPLFFERNRDNLMKGEYYLPSLVHELIEKGKARVKVLKSDNRWYGVTYPEDKPAVKKAIAAMKEYHN